jgi:hypothetical protein
MRGEGDTARRPQLLHATPQDLVGSNQHDTYDEGHGKGANEAFADAGLAVLFLGMHWSEQRAERERERERGRRVGKREKRKMTK